MEAETAMATCVCVLMVFANTRFEGLEIVWRMESPAVGKYQAAEVLDNKKPEKFGS